MTFNFHSISELSVYQDDERVKVKGCLQWNPVYGWKDLSPVRIKPVPPDQ